MLAEFQRPTYEAHLARLTLELKRRNYEVSVDDSISLLVGTRGRLHHYSQRNKQAKPIPFAHREFESVAFFLMIVVMNCFYAEMGYRMPHWQAALTRPVRGNG